MAEENKEKSSSLKIQRLINSKDKGSSATRNVIAKLFRIILVDNDITLDKFTSLKTKWLNDPNNHVRNTRTARSTASSNLIKDILKNTMTIDVFLKMMSLLKVESIAFSVTIKRKNYSKPTEHSVVIEDLPGYISTYKTSRFKAEKEEDAPVTTEPGIVNENKTLDESVDDFSKRMKEIIDSLNK
jgi:hypothetical protein